MSARRYLVFFAISSWTLLQQISGQIPTKNPCHNFRYIQENGEVIGLITLPNDLSQEYRLNVNMSVAAYLTHGENIRLQLVTGIDDIGNGQPLQYRVYFPIQRVIPFQTRVEFNGQVYCSGPPENVGKAGVTNFWATTYQLTGKPPRRRPITRPPPPSSPPPAQNSPESQNGFFFTFGAPPFNRNETYPPFVQTQIPTFTPTRRMQTTKPSRRMQTPTPTRPTPRVTQALVSGCGVANTSPFQSLIHNGVAVGLGQFPWLTALLVKIQDNPPIYRCTGTIVSTKHVVSGAFCQVSFKKESFSVISGALDIQDLVDFTGIISRVSNIDVHPKYTRDSADFNIAVFTLDRNLVYTQYIKPICIWQDEANLNDLIGRQGTIAGWGSDPATTKNVSEAVYTSIPIVSESECGSKSSVLQPLFSVFSGNTFCAGSRDGSGICNGDGGAGLMIKNENGVWHLLGIVHNSLTDRKRTCDLHNYFLFFNVAKVRPWLNDIIV